MYPSSDRRIITKEFRYTVVKITDPFLGRDSNRNFVFRIKQEIMSLRYASGTSGVRR